MNTYQSNVYRNDLSWLHFGDEPMLQDNQQVKDQQYWISVMVQLKRYRATLGGRNFIERIKSPIFLEEVLAIEII